MAYKIKKKDDFARDKEGKISDKVLSPYGAEKLRLLQGTILQFKDGILELKGNKLVDRGTGKTIIVVDNDRLVNKIVFRVLFG